MHKKAWCTCQLVVLLNKPIVVLTFSLPSPSSLLKLPKEASAEKRETGANSKDQVQVTMSTLWTITVLFRTAFTRTIKVNLLLKWLLGSNLSQWKIFCPINVSSVHYTDNFCAARKIILDRASVHNLVPRPHPTSKAREKRSGDDVVLFTHKNDCGGTFLWLNEAMPCRSRKWSVTYRIGIGRYYGAVWTPIRPVAEVNKLVQKYIKYQQVHRDKPMSGAGSPSCRPGSVQ